VIVQVVQVARDFDANVVRNGGDVGAGYGESFLKNNPLTGVVIRAIEVTQGKKIWGEHHGTVMDKPGQWAQGYLIAAEIAGALLPFIKFKAGVGAKPAAGATCEAEGGSTAGSRTNTSGKTPTPPEPPAAPARPSQQAQASGTTPKTSYPFEQKGISYRSDINNGVNGEKVIDHYISHNGKEYRVGNSTISKEGQLTHALQIPDEFRRLGISDRMYAEAHRVGFKSVKGNYNPGKDSVNFNEFWKHYDPVKGNAIEALFETPAGKMARKYGLNPKNIKINEIDNSITVDWE
jgi:hypothetical protein